MPQVVNLVLILLLGAAPLFVALRRSPWSPGETKAVMVAIPLLLFVVNAPIHETAHMVGTLLAGGTVGQVRLWQAFWRSDAPVPMIESSGLTTPSALFVSAVLPYAVDAVLLVIGAMNLRRPRIRSPWRFAAFYLFLVLKPAFDITANALAWSVYGVGDFGQMARILGRAPAGALAAALVAGGLGVTLAAMRSYGRVESISRPPA
jgi:hypothetical protein